MEKLLMRYYLWLTLLLVGGAGQLYAHHDATFSKPADTALELELDSFHTAALHDAAIINYTTQHFEKQQETIEFSQNENEEEELSIDKLHLNKKYLALNKDFLASYYKDAISFSYETLIKLLPSGKPFHSLSSRQYILFRVIRI